MTSRALIGSTGFVGSNLRAQQPFDALFHSRNIDELAGRHFETVVCAGAPAAKWIANRDPEADRTNLQRLVAALSTVTCDRFVLISTIDVYPVPAGADEGDPCDGQNHAYGAHRRWLEREVRARFSGALIARLPALFGPGLKKNVLFDLLHDRELAAIHPDARFQWYGLDRLSADLQIAQRAGLTLVNLFPAPLATRAIVERLFPDSQIGARATVAAHYDLRTRHAALFGGRNGYLEDADSVLSALARFVAHARSAP